MDKRYSNLKYILPMKRRVTDKHIKAAIMAINVLYGDPIRDIVKGFGWLGDDGCIRPECKDVAITKVTELINLSRSAIVFVEDGRLDIGRMRNNAPGITSVKPPRYDNDCAIGCVFASILVLFDKFLRNAPLIPQDEKYDYYVAVVTSLLEQVNYTNNFVCALEKRQAHRRVALGSAKKKNKIRERVYSILAGHGMNKAADANKETLAKLKKWYKQEYGQPFPYSDKKLEEYMFEYCNRH